MIFGTKHMLFQEEGEPPGGGGAAEETTVEDGGASEKPAEGDILSGREPDPGAKVETGPTTVEDGWLKGVGTEFANDPSMQYVKDLPTLVKNYINTKKLVGSKVGLPSEYATDEERREFYHKLGLPKEESEYKVGLKEDSFVNDEFIGEFREKAYESGILPSQAQTMLEWYDQKLSAIQEQDQNDYKQDVEATIEELKTEYGQAYESKLHVANRVLDRVVDAETLETMKENGLVNDKAFIQTMVKIGEMFAQEDSFDFKPKSESALTPEEAQRKINEIQGDRSHPYHNSSHPGHEEAVADMGKYFKFLG